MNYFAHFDGAEWHTVYTRFEGGDMTSVCAGGSEASHRQDAADRQAAWERQVEAQRREGTTEVRRLAPWYDEAEAR